MTPGHIPIITDRTVALEAKHRRMLWRIRTAIYAGGDAPDLFRNRRPTLTADPGSASRVARPAGYSLDRQGTYPEEFSPSEARLILKAVGWWSAVVVLTMIFVAVLLS